MAMMDREIFGALLRIIYILSVHLNSAITFLMERLSGRRELFYCEVAS
jgi:hypothetical protein